MRFCKHGRLTLVTVCMPIELLQSRGMTDSGKKIWRNARNSSLKMATEKSLKLLCDLISICINYEVVNKQPIS